MLHAAAASKIMEFWHLRSEVRISSSRTKESRALIPKFTRRKLEQHENEAMEEEEEGGRRDPMHDTK